MLPVKFILAENKVLHVFQLFSLNQNLSYPVGSNCKIIILDENFWR